MTDEHGVPLNPKCHWCGQEESHKEPYCCDFVALLDGVDQYLDKKTHGGEQVPEK